MPLADPYASVDIPPELVHQFFGVFARLEHAMKVGGFQRRGRGGRAEGDWDGLINKVGDWIQVAPGSALDAAILYLINEPPQVQMFEAGWQDKALKGDSPIARAVDGARRVRNNLFHGGKHNPEKYEGRDKRLVGAALTVLLAAIETGPLANCYNGLV